MGTSKTPRLGINPTKPGRPSHAYHSYFAANIRMVLDMEVQAGNQTAPLHAQPELWAFLDGLPEQDRPVFLRGDSHWGAEKAMLGAEERNLGYLFKLKQSANVKKLIGQIFRKEEWVEAGQQWQGREDMLRLSGWSKARRVVVLRRPLKSRPEAEAETGDKKKSKRKAAKQLTLDLPELTYQGMQYEYAVLVTSLPDEVRTIAQHYRDRGDAENNFDELKNQWGWAGFTTQDRKRCQIMGGSSPWSTTGGRSSCAWESRRNTPKPSPRGRWRGTASPGKLVTEIRPRWRSRAPTRSPRRSRKF